jgi:hypothetical protein
MPEFGLLSWIPLWTYFYMGWGLKRSPVMILDLKNKIRESTHFGPIYKPPRASEPSNSPMDFSIRVLV